MTTPVAQVRSRVPRIAEAAVERARLTVVPRGTTRAPRMPFVTLVSLLLVSGVVGLLLFNTHMQQGSFVTTSLEARATALAAKQESLQMTMDRMRDPQRVATRAKRLGMVPAANPAFLRLEDGAVLGQPTVARAEDGVRITPAPTPKPAALRPEPVVLEVPRTVLRGRSGGTARRDAGGARGSDTLGANRTGRGGEPSR